MNFVLAAAIVLSYISVYADPEAFWILAFFGLSYPFILLFNILFILFWIYRKNRLFLLSLIAILLGWNHLRSFIQFPLRKMSPETQNSFTVLSYNVRLFNLYNWNKENNTHDKIFDFINKNEIDIICFQEFLSHTGDGHLTEKEIQKKLENKYNAHFGYSFINTKSNYGIATFSKYPIVKKGLIKFSNTSNISIYTDIVINKDTIRVFNNHLQSIRFNKNNYSLINNSKVLNDDTKIKEVKDIFGRLKEAFIKRATQAEILSTYISSSPYPVMVCGDFNDTPVSYTYNTMKGNLKDSFIESGKGIGNTYIGKFPSFRIDFVFFSDKLECRKFVVPKIKHSDHYPVMGRYAISN
ncbi:MAG: hypothetical protein A2W99_07715 [Bacteroidetes bacterium GWF2_33_16]|nr:MAG: hypothetical protein A2X00_10770 [Bacteroidetes bacterium GWE2_32_14]OFY03662.1 MAG: hypothetical protein A2W99_07715 [Bacteroidetes bacterium GWF2_33_16]